MNYTRTPIRPHVRTSVYRAIIVCFVKKDFSFTTPICQIGGGSITVDGYPFEYIDVECGITMFGGLLGSSLPCFLLSMENDCGALQSIEVECWGETAKHTVLAAAKLAKQRGAKRLIFTDNSTKHIGNMSFRVSDMYVLTSGQTWYESILPIHLVREQDAQDVAIWREQVLTNTWQTVYECLRHRKPDIHIPDECLEGVDVTQKGSARIVLTKIKNMQTDFFAKYASFLILCSGIVSLHGLDWEADLSYS